MFEMWALGVSEGPDVVAIIIPLRPTTVSKVRHHQKGDVYHGRRGSRPRNLQPARCPRSIDLSPTLFFSFLVVDGEGVLLRGKLHTEDKRSTERETAHEKGNLEHCFVGRIEKHLVIPKICTL